MHPSRISRQDQESIERGIPDVLSIQVKALELNPQFIAMASRPTSTLSIAAVCLSDAAEMLCEARFALVEASIYHFVLERAEGGSPAHLFSAQFYLDDSVLRVYAAAESVAAFAYAFLDKHSLEEARTKLSKGAREGKSEFLRLTKLIRGGIACPPKLASKLIEMGGAKETKRVGAYRNDWMHSQRWRMKGTGISYDRKLRWEEKTSARGRTTLQLVFVKGDPPKITIGEAITMVGEAYRLLCEVLAECEAALRAELTSNARGLLRRALGWN